MHREARDRVVHAATEFLILAVDRVGHVDPGGEIPREVRRLQWSAFNVPLMWAAAANDQDCAILEWFNQQTESLPPVLVNGCEVAAQEALRVGWDVLCHTMRSWGVRSREDLAEWIHQQGFRRPRWGAHFSARAQERILNTTVARDARGAAIESVYIHMVLQACQSGGRRLEMGDPPTRPECTTRAQDRVESQWTTLDDVCLQEVFKQRFAILQGCPAHLKARYRHALTTALEAVHTAVQQNDVAKEIRGWKLFIVLPFWLLRRPFSRGRVGKAELSQRFDLFIGGQWDELHQEAMRDAHSQPFTPGRGPHS